MIRILHVVGEMNRGGTESMLMTLFRNINREEIQFDFMVHTQEKCAYDDEIQALGGKIYRMPKFNGFNILEYTKAWKNFFYENTEHRIIHGHIGSSATIYLLIANQFGRYSIAHSHATNSKLNNLNEILYRMASFPTRYIAKYFLACSRQAGRDRYGKFISEGSRFSVLNNAIDSKEFIFDEELRNLVRREFNIQKKFVIGHVGRFTFAKNHGFLIDIFKEIVEIDDNARLMLVGDGELKEEIQQKIIRLGLKEKVIFTGVREDVSKILQAMDIFVFPSHFEGLGIATVEAQASGLMTICADTIPREAKITEYLTYISLKEDAKVWAELILSFKKDYIRKDMYKVICDAGYDIKHTSDMLEQLYKQIDKN